MSRSFRHTPKTGVTTARSERYDKRNWHRRYRAIQRSILSHRHLDYDDMVMSLVCEICDVWDFAKDGKIYWGFFWEKWEEPASRLEAWERKKWLNK
jgi:hypothetical protein